MTLLIDIMPENMTSFISLIPFILVCALALLVLYLTVRRRWRDATSSPITQENLTSIPTWKRSYGLDLQQPYRREPYRFEV
ncbi:hypothetical protein PENCOP_c012G07876 [Penicillium coprophilum]|uniref:Uncharacterized protein n=1 Tax=Penicillium coprophilum TaxID=36646 RepID=A0A1V6UC49_9EURO|nr:hypothetical protein PENCOP_c012G07876 [Penicillium coprophilum]